MLKLRALLLTAVWSMVMASAVAAEDLQVTIRNAPPGVTVEFLLVSGSETKNARGAADAKGVMDLVLMGIDNFKGKSYQLVITDCDGKVVRMTLVAEGTPEPACGEQTEIAGQVHQKCRCRRVGVLIFIGKDAIRLIADAASGTISVVGQPTTAAGGGAPVGFLFDVDFGAARFGGADDVCSEARNVFSEFGITGSCSADKTVSMFSIDGGVTFARFFGVKVGYLQIGEVNVDASGTATGLSVTQSGFFGPARGATFVGVVQIPLGRVDIYGKGGVWVWSADSGATVSATVGAQQFTERFEQSDSGTDGIFGGGVIIWFTNNLGLNAGISSVRLSSSDNAEDGGEVDERFTTYFVGLKVGIGR